MKLGTFLFWFITFTWTAITLASCAKAGTGGQAEVSAIVKHHDRAIPGATILVKYNAKEFPGSDPSLYDQQVQTGSSGHSAGHAHIKELKHGDYFFYSTGYDSSIAMAVSGGLHLEIKRKERKSEIHLEIPVTE